MKVRILIRRSSSINESSETYYIFPLAPREGDLIECLDENEEQIAVIVKELRWKAIPPEEAVLLLECEPKQ